MTTSINVIYTGFDFEVVVDGAGLDIIATGRTSHNELCEGGAGHELFMAIVDEYSSIGLESALENAGAILYTKVGA